MNKRCQQNIRKSNPAIYKKDNLHHNKVGFIPELKAEINIAPINSLKKKNHKILLIKRMQNRPDNQHSVLIKTSQQIRNRREFPQLGNLQKKVTANIIRTEKRL